MSEELPRRAFLGAAVRIDGERVAVTRVLAEESPLREGDVLCALDGEAITTVERLGERLRAAASREAIALRIERAGSIVELELPVRPMPREQLEGASVRYGHVRWRGHRLRTISTVPRSPIATVLFLQGIYCQSVDLPLSPDAPLSQLVRAWSERGLATLRVERPGIGDSEGPPCAELDLAGEIELYEGALASIAGPPLLFGHSLGGVVASALAARSCGVVAYGAPGTPWTRTVREGMERQLRLRGASEPDLAARLARFDADPFEERHGRALALHRQLDALDLAEAWRRVPVPVLVLAGEHDWVTGEQAQRAIAEHAREAELVRLDGLDHSFTRHASLADSLRDHGRGAFDARIAEETARFARALSRDAGAG